MIWTPIPDFDRYSVSDEGEVRNDETNRILANTSNQQGIFIVGMMGDDDKQYKRSVAVLVANAYLDPPASDMFDTPIHINGEREDCSADNLAWRPRWFAIKYHKQFHDDHQGFTVPIRDLKSGVVYPNSWEAALDNGLLEQEIVNATLRRTYVWPTYQEFTVIHD